MEARDELVGRVQARTHQYGATAKSGACKHAPYGLAALQRIAWVLVLLPATLGARHRTDNFIVETFDPQLARQLAEAAERYRRDLAVAWLGRTMPNWAQPCVMTVQVGEHLGAGGATTFVFEDGEVFGWRMSIQGSVERLFDSVLPHEITHMVFASHFRQPLPRWADEGGATSVEHISEREKHRRMLRQFLQTRRGIPLDQMFAMTEYPADIMPLYAQAHSLADLLIQTGGRRKYVEFLDDGLASGDWPGAVRRHYGVDSLQSLQDAWLAWVRQGSPTLKPRDAQPLETKPDAMLAGASSRQRPEPNLILRIPNETPAEDSSSGEPTAALVPVRFPASGRPSEASTSMSRPVEAAVATTTPSKLNSSTGTALKWLDPKQPFASSEGESHSMHVAHPQPVEAPRQRILR